MAREDQRGRRIRGTRFSQLTNQFWNIEIPQGDFFRNELLNNRFTPVRGTAPRGNNQFWFTARSDVFQTVPRFLASFAEQSPAPQSQLRHAIEEVQPQAANQCWLAFSEQAVI